MAEIVKELEKYKLYTVKELMPVLKKSDQTIIIYLKTGKLKGKKIGNQWRVSEEALKEFLQVESKGGKKK